MTHNLVSYDGVIEKKGIRLALFSLKKGNKCHNHSIDTAANPAKQLPLAYTALPEAPHCVIACDIGEVAVQVKLDRRGETDWMKDSTPNFHPHNEAKILLAGVAFEPLVGEAIAMVLVVRERFQRGI
jgi:hypothetical protein